MRYLRALTLSLLVHTAILILFWALVPETTQVHYERTAYVDLLEAPELPRRPKQPDVEGTFVRSAPAPKELLTNEEKEKRFSSEEEQNVIAERQARVSGMTANRSGAASDATNRASKKSEERARPGKELQLSPRNTIRRMAEAELSKENGDIETGPDKKEMNDGKPLDFSRFGSVERGVSTIGESLPEDIKFGDFTALNTDRHLYYTFYSRVEEMIRNRWVNYAKAVVYGVANGTERVSAGRVTWVTKLEVLLDAKGNFVRAVLHESSGVRNLDAAPVQAFRDAQQFPNPPTEMVKEDGQIHIYYAFSVNIVPQYAGRAPEGSDAAD